MPHTDLVYIADSAWCPYGNKSQSIITKRVSEMTENLLSKGCGSVVIACNSATIASVEALRCNYPISFTGMEPGVKPAVQQTTSNVVGVLATEASLAGKKFHQLVSQHGGSVEIITTPCPQFVELVEAGVLRGQQVDDAIDTYTASMIAAGADTIVLGCTHYPFLRDAITARIGAHIKLIDTGEAVARQAKKQYLNNFAEPACSTNRQITVYTTGSLEHLKKLFPLLCSELTASLHKLS
jgi:glutamate racemase